MKSFKTYIESRYGGLDDYYDITADEADAIVKKYKLRRIIGKANMPSKEKRPLIGLLYMTDDESLQITNDGSGWRVNYTNSAAQAAVKKMVG